MDTCGLWLDDIPYFCDYSLIKMKLLCYSSACASTSTYTSWTGIYTSLVSHKEETLMIKMQSQLCLHFMLSLFLYYRMTNIHVIITELPTYIYYYSMWKLIYEIICSFIFVIIYILHFGITNIYIKIERSFFLVYYSSINYIFINEDFYYRCFYF